MRICWVESGSMTSIEIFINFGICTYNGEQANYNALIFEFESELTGLDAANQAYKIINFDADHLTNAEKSIRSKYFEKSIACIYTGDIVVVGEESYMYFPMGWKQL